MQALDIESFEQVLAQAEGFVLVDFWAPWCAPCRVVTPILEALEDQYEAHQVIFCKVNVEDVPFLMQAFKLKSIPSVLLMKPYTTGEGAEVIDALIGAQPMARYAQWLNSYLYPKPSLWTRVKALLHGDRSVD